MLHIDCSWCDTPVELDSGATSIRCDGCSIEVELAADDLTREVSLAA
jgi:LSD1 subclass zinc finger protein